MHGDRQNSWFIKVSDYNNVLTNSYNIEIRKVQALTGERSFTLVLPKQFAAELGIGRGDFLKCYLDAGKLIVEKMDASISTSNNTV